MKNEKIFLVLLHSIWLNHKNLNNIFHDNSEYKSYYNNLSFLDLKKLWLRENKINSVLKKKEDITPHFIEKKLKEREVSIITINEKFYPNLLKEIPNKPYFIYLRWSIDNSLKISVVGSRNITSYWKKTIEAIIPTLSKYFIIVSWWANWCDSEAHLQTLNSWNKTISVVWTWIDIDYPASNKRLYDSIVANWWAVISIFPIWELGQPYNFPIRNEIVAGLSVWTLVIEAKEKSWSLITAKLSLDLWRDLFSIPWEIFKSNSHWCNNLIKNSEAKLVGEVNDILEEYNIDFKFNKKNLNIKFTDSLEKNIYDYLLLENLSLNDLSKKLSIDIQTISQKISLLELKWITKRWNLWNYNIVY